jgi:hypothetical protein
VVAFPAKARTAADGTLTLELSTGMRETDVDVLVVVEALQSGEHSGTPAAEWPAGYFELFGSLRDVNLERPPQGGQQERPPLE